ncbi:MAG: hypothetical protein D8M59_09235 [Planctomycetes bacterium]|nr:hypothetical protein [Planctomycetota bacterium]
MMTTETNDRHFLSRLLLLTAICLMYRGEVFGQQVVETKGEAPFTYRGQLMRQGKPVGDLVDFEFTLWDAAEGGSQIGQPQWVIGQAVVEGLFSVSLDFGADSFIGNTTERWLEITVLSSLDTEPVTLVPRQRIAVAPFALYALKTLPDDGAGAPGSGTATPTDRGPVAVTGDVGRDGRNGRDGLGKDGANGHVGDTFEDPMASPWQVNGSDIYYTTGNVGIGTSTPQNDLYVVNPTAADNEIAMVGWANGATGRTFGGWFQSLSSQGRGIQGYASSTTGLTFGGLFQSDGDEGRGVYGFAKNTGDSATYGGYFQAKSTKGRGVFGYADSSTGTTFGVLGQARSSRGRGVYGLANSTSGLNYGVYGQSNSTDGVAVMGWADSAEGSPKAVWGHTENSGGFAGYFTGGKTYFEKRIGVGTTSPAYEIEVVGTIFAEATDGVYEAIRGESAASGTYAVSGVAVASSGTRYGGWFGTLASSGNYAVYGDGNTGASGVKAFHIDHPMDPANKFLNHYSTESPVPYLTYRGTVVLDGAGEAWVDLPDYFEAINRDYHYQLTAVGAPGPNLYIADKISGNRFRIAGGTPGGEVSWTVTGTRDDPWVRAHETPDAYDKPVEQRGLYIRPELYGRPQSEGIFARYKDRSKRAAQEGEADSQRSRD